MTLIVTRDNDGKLMMLLVGRRQNGFCGSVWRLVGSWWLGIANINNRWS